MRNREEVLQRFTELRKKRLGERKKEYLSCTHQNCKHSESQKVNGKGKICFCQNVDVLSRVKREVLVCNDKVAKKCPYYCCGNTVESVEKDFNEILKSPSRCGEVYPKMAMLIWFLQSHHKESRWVRLCRGIGYLLGGKWW